MSDSVDIVVQDQDKAVALYAHWDGYRAERVVARALDRGRDRWDDFPYLARIVFSEMVRDDIDGSTGFGIDTEAGAGDKKIEINLTNQEVDGVPFNDFIYRYL